MYLIAKEPGSVLSVPFTVDAWYPEVPLTPATIEDSLEEYDETSTRLGFEPLPLAMRPDGDADSHSVTIKIGKMPQEGREEYIPTLGEDMRKRREFNTDVKRSMKRKRMQERNEKRGRRDRPSVSDESEFVEGGRVLVGYLRSATIGLGSVVCWVDEDQQNGTVLEGWWNIEERNMGM